MRVAIAMPTGDMVHADTAMCLARLVAYTCAGNIQVAIINPKSSLIQKGRCDAIEMALKIDASKILFIDSDMVFPHNTLVQLIKARKDIVGCACPRRKEPIVSTARHKDGSLVELDKMGVVEVEKIGTGILLIDLFLFRGLKKPYFNVEWDGKDFIGEDFSFCEKAKKAGNKIYADLDLSGLIGHIGTKTHYLESKSDLAESKLCAGRIIMP